MARPTSKYRGGFERCSTISWRACPRIAGRRFATNWTYWIGSPALCVDCAGVTPTFGLGDRHAYLERRMKKFWPVPDCRIEQIIPDGPTQLRIAARSRVIRYKIHAVENRADSNAAQGMVPGQTVPQTSRCPTLMQPWRGCPR